MDDQALFPWTCVIVPLLCSCGGDGSLGCGDVSGWRFEHREVVTALLCLVSGRR
jgi:hypothetical protein